MQSLAMQTLQGACTVSSHRVPLPVSDVIQLEALSYVTHPRECTGKIILGYVELKFKPFMYCKVYSSRNGRLRSYYCYI